MFNRRRNVALPVGATGGKGAEKLNWASPIILLNGGMFSGVQQKSIYLDGTCLSDPLTYLVPEQRRSTERIVSECELPCLTENRNYFEKATNENRRIQIGDWRCKMVQSREGLRVHRV
jgi:hypothetical protein